MRRCAIGEMRHDAQPIHTMNIPAFISNFNVIESDPHIDTVIGDLLSQYTLNVMGLTHTLTRWFAQPVYTQRDGPDPHIDTAIGDLLNQYTLNVMGSLTRWCSMQWLPWHTTSNAVTYTCSSHTNTFYLHGMCMCIYNIISCKKGATNENQGSSVKYILYTMIAIHCGNHVGCDSIWPLHRFHTTKNINAEWNY